MSTEETYHCISDAEYIVHLMDDGHTRADAEAIAEAQAQEHYEHIQNNPLPIAPQ